MKIAFKFLLLLLVFLIIQENSAFADSNINMVYREKAVKALISLYSPRIKAYAILTACGDQSDNLCPSIIEISEMLTKASVADSVGKPTVRDIEYILGVMSGYITGTVEIAETMKSLYPKEYCDQVRKIAKNL